MTSSGPNSPALGVSSSDVGAVAWSTPTNIYTSNDARATAALNNQQSQYLKATTFSFAIPGGAVIDGIKVEIEKSRTAGTGTLSDTTVKLVKRGVIVGQNRASQGAAWTGTDAYSTYGDTIDTWGSVWTPNEINAYDFGVVFSCTETASLSATAGIDHVRITVYYTDGYLSGAQVQNSGEVLLFGQRYKLASGEDSKTGRVGVTLATTFPQKIDTGFEYTRQSNPIVESYTVDDLSGGIGLRRYRSPKDFNRSSSQTNINGHWPGAITVGPAINTTGTQPASTDITGIGTLGSGVNIAVVYDTGALYNFDGTTWSALIDTLPGEPRGDSIEFNNRLYWPLGSVGISYQATTASVAVDTAAGASDPGAVAFAIWDSQLWALDNLGKLWKSSTGNAGSWTGLATLPPFIGTTTLTDPKSQLVIYDDASGDPTIWALTSWGLYIYDAVNDKWFTSRFYHAPHHLPVVNGGAEQFCGIVFRGSLYHRYKDLTLANLTMVNGSLLVDPFGGPFQPNDRLSFVASSYISYLATDNFMLFCGVSDNIGTGKIDSILSYDGVGWQTIFEDKSRGASDIQQLRIVGTTAGYRLYFFSGVATPGVKSLFYIDLAKLAEHPIDGSGSDFTTSGYVFLPRFDAFQRAQIKTAQQVRVKLSGASSTETVNLLYRLNGSTGSFTSVGTVAVSTEVVIPLGTNGTGISFNDWQWEFLFAAAGGASAPKIEHVTLDYVRKEEVQRGFQATLDLTDSFAGRTPQQMIDHLWVHMKSENWGTFAYKDDSDNTRSYLVKLMRPSGEENTGSGSSGKYTVTMVEMGPNP